MKIFMHNKRSILSLFREGLILPSKEIANLFDEQYRLSFLLHPEIEPFLDSLYDCCEPDKNDSLYETKRSIGENDELICKMIRDDDIDKFVPYVNQNCISLNSNIKSSLYETNSFLIENKNTTLIQYAAFYGSIRIFNYLRMNYVELESSLWLYAIHSNIADMIHLLETIKLQPPNDSYCCCLEE